MVERLAVRLRRPAVAAIVLLLVYGALSFLNDPDGYLGTDTGAKVATLEVMDATGRLDPDVGYWAERWDPTGELHPLYQASKHGSRWIDVTTLPMLYAAYPLYKLGGLQLALLLPMVGAVSVALAARRLAVLLGADRPDVTFWLVGLASPFLIYALDFWEHAPGTALVLWAVVLLLEEIERSATWWRPLVAGLLFGAAFSMRTESLVYAAVAVGVAGLVTLVPRQGIAVAARLGLAAVVGIIPPIVLNQLLEVATAGGSIRLGRAGGAAAAVGTKSQNLPGGRLDDAIVTTLNLQPALDRQGELMGAALLLLLVWFTAKALRQPPDARFLRIIGTVLIALYLVRFLSGAGFVPGMFAAAPIAAVGLVVGLRSWPARYATAVALAALPLVWLTMFTGGAVPQWGGRYQLASAALLVTVGSVALPRLPKPAAALLAGLSIFITVLGLVWLSERSHGIGDAGAALVRRPEPVLVSNIAHLWRETGVHYGEHLELTAIDQGQLDRAASVVEQAGFSQLGFVMFDDTTVADPSIAGWRVTAHGKVDLLPGVPLRIVTFDRAG